MSTVFFLNGDSVADNSEHAVAITNTGVVVSTAQSRFGGSSLYFNGSANLTFRLKEDCFAGTHDWTVDWWEYRLGAKTSSAVFCRPITSSASSGLILCDDNGQGGLSMYESSSGSAHDIASGVKIGTRTLNAWVHRAVVKKNGVYTAYENGVKVTSVTYTGSIATSTTPMRIGNYGTSMFYGYIDEFRISDVAKWSENFNPTVINDVDESEITELEFIQSSGTQYTNTGFKPNQNTRTVMTAAYLSGDVLFGSTNTSSSGMHCLQRVSGKVYVYWDTNALQTSGVITTGQVHTFDLNKNRVLLDGVELASFTTKAFQCNYPIPLCCINVGGSIGYFASLKLNSCQIYDNGLLERDYIPAKLTNGEVGLYDRVFHEFYRNAGTGEFIAGPEMVHDGYTELEWIKADGASYINTNFAPNQNTRVYAECELPISASSNQGLFGARVSSSSSAFQFVTQGGYYRSDYNGTLTTISSEDYGTAKFYVDKNKNATDLNGQYSATATYAAFSCPHSMYIFATNNNGALYAQSSTKLFVMKIYDNGTLVRSYIPMLHPSGVAGLWESVNERFYASSTTTDLIAGPKVQTVPKSPANFRVESATDTLVTLAWDESDKAVGYRLYKSGQLLADTTETSISVTVEPFADAVFTLTAYNENGEGAGAELTYFNAPDDPILFLVTDRTQQDVALGNTKGTYNASDLNRVGYAVAYLADRLLACGVQTTVHPKTDWVTTDIPAEQVLVTYLQNVRKLRTALTLVASAPEVPQDMQFFTYTEANDIEMLLVMLDTHITKMLSIVDTNWAVGSTYTGLYAKEAYR